MAQKHSSTTERLLTDAGIVEGMRVLDVGCGGGDVSMLIARLVGTSGQVVGIDRNPRPLQRARENAQTHGIANATFIQGDITEPLPAAEPFDAIVGRRVLMYLPDPAKALRNLSLSLRAGGIVAFEETDATMIPGHPTALPLHNQVLGWIWETIKREGGNPHMGFDLPRTFAQAGLVPDHIWGEAVIEDQAANHSLATIVRFITSRIVAHNVATEAEIDLDTLEDRMRAERPDHAVFVSAMAFGAWAHKP